MHIDRDRATHAFESYVERFDPQDPKIALKVDHTWRVADLAEKIARSLPEGASPQYVDLAWLLGLLHDVGRFEQVRRYGTFNDAASTSHAALGARVLFDGLDGAAPTIRDYVDAPDEDAPIRTAVALHSSWRLPQDLDARTRRLCELLRDADKVDILKVNCTCPVEDIYGFPERTLLESELSQEAASWFWQHSTIPRAARRYPADILLGHVCFAWEMAFPQSLAITAEQGCVFRMMERPFARDDTRAAFARMERHLRAWMEEQLR